jgi:hypothetical protein
MKTYELVIKITDQGDFEVDGTNDGFTALELLGVLYWKVKDIENQIFGDIKPSVVSRKVVKEGIQNGK